MRFLLSLLLLLFSFNANVKAVSAKAVGEPTKFRTEWTKPFLYEISAPWMKKESYMVGTIHLPDDRLYYWPPTMLNVFAYVDEIFTEINYKDRDNKAFLTYSLTRPRDLMRDIPRTTVDKLDRYLKSVHRNLGYKIFYNLKVWAIMASLPLFKHQFENPTAISLDEVIWKLAEQKRKKAYGLENLKEHMKAFDSLKKHEAVTLLDDTLDALFKNPRILELMMEAFLKGDEARLKFLLTKYAQDSSSKEAEKFNQKILGDRDQDFARKITAVLKRGNGKSFLFAFGAAHLIIDGSVPDILRDKYGVKVRRLPIK